MNKTEIKVRNADRKIKFTEHRIKLLSKWDAPKKLSGLKNHCIGTLRERIIFMKNHAMEKKEFDYEI